MPGAGGTPGKAKATPAKSTPGKNATPKAKSKDASAAVDTTPTPTPAKRKRAPAKATNAAAATGTGTGTDIDGKEEGQGNGQEYANGNGNGNFKQERTYGDNDGQQNSFDDEHNRNTKRARIHPSMPPNLPLNMYPNYADSNTAYAPINPGFGAGNIHTQDPAAAARLADLHAQLEMEVMKAQVQMHAQSQMGMAGVGIRNGGVIVKREPQNFDGAGLGGEMFMGGGVNEVDQQDDMNEAEQYFDALDRQEREMGVQKVSEWLGDAETEV